MSKIRQELIEIQDFQQKIKQKVEKTEKKIEELTKI